VLEFNGSEAWMQQHWGRALQHADIAAEIEAANIELADLVIVVSEASRKELESRAIRARNVLVNPNGVDAQMYRPDVDGAIVRRDLGVQDKWIFGFIGTFGRWHGAEVLVDAFGRLLQRRPDLRPRLRLLLIGDGPTLPDVRRIVADRSMEAEVILAGRIAQQDGPSYLAACDVLVSPHVPNPDGTAFFGSPTKLFEYMAMGRPIVASNLDQIGQVLEHEVTAILVRPGDAGSLSHGMERTVEESTLCRALGANARHEVIARYTWRAHTERIIAALKKVAA
jgi:glycosyltransferase involved in cell wall biosynthesis